MATRDFPSLINTLNAATSVEELHGTCAEACKSYGFDHFLYCARIPTSLVKPSIVIISGYPKEWRDYYNDRQYMHIDPTVVHGATRITPLRWQDIRSDDRQVRRFIGEAGEHGLRSGLSLPVHGAKGEAGMLNLASEQNQPPDDRFLPDLHLFTSYLHEAARRIIEIREISPTPLLTRREVECLLWAAEGKTSWETSQILKISERTVTFHLQNAGSKLNVNNRQHAVARAVSLGLLNTEI